MNASLICKIAAVVILCAPLHAYGDLLEYKCEIPNGLDKKIVLVAKDGTKIESDAHQIYRECYRQEWIKAIQCHLAKGNVPMHLLFREDVQEYGIMAQARRIGNLEAQVMLSKAYLVYEDEKLDKMLADLLRKEQASEQE
jgi:hypothetical protein